MENIKNILNSDAGFLIDNNNDNKKTVVDNRFELITQIVEALENKDDIFYTELIRLISNNIDRIYDGKIENYKGIVFDKEGKLIHQGYDYLDADDTLNLRRANRDLSSKLYEYVCDILEKNSNIQLDIEILKRLLSRNPKLFTLIVEESYYYRPFDFERLAKILNNNQTLKKSNISIDEVYQLLIDTCQIDNIEVCGKLIQPEEFKQNNQKIVEFLEKCNAASFAKVTNIITKSLDQNFDRFIIAKERNINFFCERVIIELLTSHITMIDEDYDFIHKLLTDETIKIDYSYDWADYFGQTSLVALIAFSGNKTIIKDLLSKEENIKRNYWYGESHMPLYRLYAITGEYEKALSIFTTTYNCASDYTEDFDDDFNRRGYTYGDISYQDSLVSFIDNMCTSFENENITYSERKNIIERILNDDKVKYVNLEEILPLVQTILSEQDFKSLLYTLMEKYHDGKLKFIVVNENDGIYSRYLIKVASDEEIQNILSTFDTKEQKTKKLTVN